jgi:hypothetical protein
VILLETKVANPLQRVTISFQILFLFQTKSPNTYEKEKKNSKGKEMKKGKENNKKNKQE